MIDRDGIISHSENAVESTERKGKTRFLSCLGEKLILNRHARKVQSIGTHESGKTATAISNLERGAILLVRGRSRGVVLGMEKTGDGRTFRGRNPKIRTSRIEHDFECLWRRPKTNLRIIYKGRSVPSEIGEREH